MENTINPTTREKSLILTNADNETVYVSEWETLKELVEIAGLDNVEIYYPKAGWGWLRDAVESKCSQNDETDFEKLESFFDVWQTELTA